LKFEFILIEKLDHKAAREVYESLDLFVDQLLAGWYGGVAVELMALGVPVIAYIREDDLRFINPKMKSAIPIINADPNSIEEILEDLIKKPISFLTNLGLRSRKYVEEWHNPESISEKILLEIVLIIIYH
jgi:glycosyltransferase involved in cell wall biosynthesis